MGDGNNGKSFLATLPGILTGLAALISAVAGIWYILPQTPEIYLDVYPNNIISGDSVTLSWSVSNSENIFIDHGIGSADSKGNRQISPKETSIYTLTAKNKGKEAIKTVQISVSPKLAPELPEISYFKTNRDTIFSGESALLSWSTTKAGSVFIDNGIGAVEQTGSMLVSPTSTTTYLLTAQSAEDKVTKTVQVSVTVPQNPFINYFTATPDTIKVGDSSTLGWSTTNAESVTIDNVIGSVAKTGTAQVSPQATIKYTLTAQNRIKQVSKEIKVIVTAPQKPDINYFTASPETIDQGGESTLTWSTSNAESVTIDNGIGSVSQTGTTQVSPPITGTTEYILTATNIYGVISQSAKVTVTQPVVTVSGRLKPVPVSEYKDRIGMGGDLSGVPPGMG